MDMINNLEQIKPLLKFESEDDFYHLQIIRRKKENKGMGSNSKIIKTYYIRSTEHLELYMDEIILLCNFWNARACINLNKRSFEKLAFHNLRKVTDQIMNKDYKSVRKSYESVAGTYSNESNKKWIIDVDNANYDDPKEAMFYLELDEFLRNLAPIGPKILTKLKTKSGYHIITSPFNVQEFNKKYQFDLHKDNPTILYIP